MKKILVTGGGGYIGTVVVEDLLKNGYQVRVLDKFYYGEKTLDHVRDKIEIINQDIRKVKKDVLENVDAIIHLAGFSTDSESEANPKATYGVNTYATEYLAKIAKSQGIDKFTFASTASIYHAEAEDEIPLKDEKSKVNPQALYAVSKYQAERKLLSLADKGFCLVIFRLGTVYGFSPRMRYNLVVNTMLKDGLFKKKISINGGNQWRPLIDVNDVSSALIRAVEEEKSKICGHIFNLVYRNYKIRDLSRKVAKVLSRVKHIHPRIKIHKPNKIEKSYRISGRKINRFFNWKPQISIEQSVEDMIEKIEKWDYKDFTNPRYYSKVSS